MCDEFVRLTFVIYTVFTSEEEICQSCGKKLLFICRGLSARNSDQGILQAETQIVLATLGKGSISLEAFYHVCLFPCLYVWPSIL